MSNQICQVYPVDIQLASLRLYEKAGFVKVARTVKNAGHAEGAKIMKYEMNDDGHFILDGTGLDALTNPSGIRPVLWLTNI